MMTQTDAEGSGRGLLKVSVQRLPSDSDEKHEFPQHKHFPGQDWKP